MNYRRHEDAMTGEIRRLFRRQAAQARQRVLGKQARKGTRYWEGGDPTKAIDPLRVFSPDAWRKETADMLGGVITDIVDQTGQALFDTFREPEKALVPQNAQFNVHNPNVSRALTQRVNRLVGVNDTTAESIRSELVTGEAAGESITHLADRVQGVFDQATRVRAVTIARTEVVGAVNEGNVFAAEQTGLELTKQWLSAADDRVRGNGPNDEWSHVEADGEEVALDEPFTATGEDLDYPGDPTGSPGNVINCRCTVVYNGDLSLTHDESTVLD